MGRTLDRDSKIGKSGLQSSFARKRANQEETKRGYEKERENNRERTRPKNLGFGNCLHSSPEIAAIVQMAALLGSTITGDVGLRLLLCPLGSNVVIRTACCSVGIALPVYSTFKAIEQKDQNEQERWLIYWAAYGSFSLAEVFSDKILSWFPMYYYVKFAFLVWLQFPLANGSRHLYSRHLRPFLRRHQARLDRVVGIASSEIFKLICARQAEIQFVTDLVRRFGMTASQMMKDAFQPARPQGRRTIEGPTRQGLEDSDSDHGD